VAPLTELISFRNVRLNSTHACWANNNICIADNKKEKEEGRKQEEKEEEGKDKDI
jgi:hypothetical protein